MQTKPPKTKKRKRYYRESYSQEGEDMILASVFEGQRDGFFVDVGAHHPKRFSNTYRFYSRGWRGINIDATPGCMKAFRRSRPEDINLEAAVSDSVQTLNFYLFNEPALNTFDRALATERHGFLHFQIVREVAIQTVTLRSLLDLHLQAEKPIDFLNVDVEGLDLQVLKSNDWDRYRPKVVLVEDNTIKAWNEIANSPTVQFLTENGYEPFSRTFRTLLFMRN
jgi:FkbM family methyltransferase